MSWWWRRSFPDARRGGVYSAEVARAYAEAGHRVTVLTQHAEEVDQTDAREHSAFTVHRVPRGSQLLVGLWLLGSLLRLRRRERFDLVHATTWRVAVPVRLALRGVPLRLSVHGREVLHFPGRPDLS